MEVQAGKTVLPRYADITNPAQPVRRVHNASRLAAYIDHIRASFQSNLMCALYPAIQLCASANEAFSSRKHGRTELRKG